MYGYSPDSFNPSRLLWYNPKNSETVQSKTLANLRYVGGFENA